MNKYSQIWNLSGFFADDKAFEKHLEKIRQILSSYDKSAPFGKQIDALQEFDAYFSEAESYIHCRGAQNVEDVKADFYFDKLQTLRLELENLYLEFDDALKTMSEDDFQKTLEDHSDLSFVLTERRRRATEKLPLKEERLMNSLSVDGYHGWAQLYETSMGNLRFPFEGKDLSFGQIENQVHNPNRSLRKKAFETIEEIFKKNVKLFARNLNHLGGFRIKLYKNRGWTNVLKEALDMNRLEQKTLDVMWEVVSKNKGPLIEYLKCKAALHSLPKLSWFDVDAPLASHSEKIPYDDGAAFIMKHFERFSPKFAGFTKRALEEKWIEAENRRGKRAGGFCTPFPMSKESRIFMTYDGTLQNVSTLAHELGHAFHSDQMFDLPIFNQHYAMNVAETASTMAEMIVSQASIDECSDDKLRLGLLDDQIGRSVAFMMNIHARFLFETRFYAARERGYVLPDQLSEIMLEAQKEAYCNELESWHPLFWAAKMHFYFTDVPFYNFPYAFGYLFSLGIYSMAESDSQFGEKYIALLRDTGRMTTEEIAKKHLDMDLTKPDFWQKAIAPIHKNIETFLKLSGN